MGLTPRTAVGIAQAWSAGEAPVNENLDIRAVFVPGQDSLAFQTRAPLFTLDKHQGYPTTKKQEPKRRGRGRMALAQGGTIAKPDLDSGGGFFWS